jgi:hypothetical protein
MQMNTAQTATPRTPQQIERITKGIALLRSTYSKGCQQIAAKKRAKSDARKPNKVPNQAPKGWFISKDGMKIHA